MTWLTVTEVLCHNWPRICSVCRNQNPVFSSWLTYHRVCNKSNTTSVICGAGTAHSSGAHEFTPGFSGIRVARSLVFCVVICTSLFVLLSDFLFAVVLCVPLRFTASDYPLYICIFKLFFLPQGRRSLALSLSPLSSILLVLRRLALH